MQLARESSGNMLIGLTLNIRLVWSHPEHNSDTYIPADCDQPCRWQPKRQPFVRLRVHGATSMPAMLGL